MICCSLGSMRGGSLRFSFVAIVLFFALLPVEPARGQSLDDKLRYISALRNNGFSELAIDFIEIEQQRFKLDDIQRASLEFELAATRIDASESEGDLGDRQKRLEEARRSLRDFASKYPDHPRRPESLVQLATIDLQMGRLRVIEAQLPANEGRAQELVEEARKLFTSAYKSYDEAHRQLEAALAQMPAFLDPREERDKYRQRDRYFEQQIEAKFQSGLSTFFLADSYATVDSRGLDPSSSPEYRANLEKALKIFEAIFNDHRRDLVGLYANLWMARCLAGLGEHGRAMGIYDLLMEHENRELEPFQREVFHFRLISMAGQQKWREMILLADPWLRKNTRFREEWAYQGAQMMAARAYIALGKSTQEPSERTKHFREADRMLEALARYPNPLTGLARREQLDLAKLTNKAVEGSSFQELVTLANARLDELKPDLPDDQRSAVIEDAIAKFQSALRAVKRKDEPEDVGSARLSLAYAYLQKDDIFSAAVLGESIARYLPKFSQSSEGGMFALSSYARLYDEARKLKDAGQDVNPDVDAAYMARIAELIVSRWPRSSQADEARLTLGKLEYSRRQYEKAAEYLDAVNPRSVVATEATSLAGGSLWEDYKTKSKEGASKEDLVELRARALDRLQRASVAMKKGAEDVYNRARFLNDAILAEASYENSDDAKALEVLQPLIKQITANELPEEVEADLRIAALVTAMQAYVRGNKLEETEELIKVLSEQEGSSKSTNVTIVFINLARRLRDQLARLRQGGQTQEAQKMITSFETFLDRVAERDAGQTLQSLVYLGDTYLEIERFDKAVALLQKAVSQSDASSDEAQAGALLRGKLLLARALSRKGDAEAAKSTITDLLRSNPNSRDIIFERGDILEAAKDFPAAIKHWQWFIDRLKRVEPRPDELYQATERLMDVYVKMSSSLTGNQKRQALLMAYRLPVYLLETDQGLPAQWRESLEQKAAKIQSMMEKS